MSNIEICLNCDDLILLKQNVSTAYKAGVQRIELCSNMQLDGLTPSSEAIKIARKGFGERSGLLVMIRPRSNDFCYSYIEIKLMLKQITQAKSLGANGVVLGCLTTNNTIDIDALSTLVSYAKSLFLEVTFHRAFDAVQEPKGAIHTLIEHNVDRILTSGVQWGKQGSAVNGLKNIAQTIYWASENIEIVVGGGVNIANAKVIHQCLSSYKAKTSLHAYSGVLIDGVVQQTLIDSIANK